MPSSSLSPPPRAIRNQILPAPKLQPKNGQTTDLSVGIRTDKWFAIGDANEYTVVPSVAPPPMDIRPASSRRRTFVRVVGVAALLGTLSCLYGLATHGAARKAILQWAMFGQRDPVHLLDKVKSQVAAHR
jgi:hypothetical protein